MNIFGDMCICDFQHVMIQICDDPFEVKLGDNHEVSTVDFGYYEIVHSCYYNTFVISNYQYIQTIYIPTGNLLSLVNFWKIAIYSSILERQHRCVILCKDKKLVFL